MIRNIDDNEKNKDVKDSEANEVATEKESEAVYNGESIDKTTDIHSKLFEEFKKDATSDRNLKKIKAENKEKRKELKALRTLRLKEKRARMHVSGEKVDFISRIKRFWPLSKTAGRILLIYLAIILAGGFLLSIPGVVTSQSDSDWNVLTGIFTASSAFSDTGLSIISTFNGYSIYGQIIILVLIQVGGIGVLTIKVAIIALFRGKITYDASSSAHAERGNGTLNQTKDMIFFGIGFLLVLEFVGTFLLFFAFFFIHAQSSQVENINYEYIDYAYKPTALWAALFHSVSATNNAGFDIVSDSSLMPYNQDEWGYFIQAIFMFQWIVGGLGFPTFYDIRRKIKARKTGDRVRFSLFTKLNIIVYIVLFIAGPLFIFLSEVSSGDNSQILYKWSYQAAADTIDDGILRPPLLIENEGLRAPVISFMDIMFNATSCRNAGFSTIDINNFNGGSKVIMSIMMFIGSAPSSTAGGIRTTTFAILILEIWAIMRSQKELYIFKKHIPQETVKRSLAVFFISLVIIIIGCLIVYMDSYDATNVLIENTSGPSIDGGDTSLTSILAMVTSAFGTVGVDPFTSGVHSQMWHLGIVSKLALIFIMFIGQVGVSNTLLVFVKPRNKREVSYLDEDVTIG